MVDTVLRAAGEQNNPLIPAVYDIIWSLVCFIVILIFFWVLALPRMRKMLDERSSAIEGNIGKADVARKEAEAALERYTAQLAEARGEAGRIREQARDDGKRILAEMKEQATAEAGRIVANAQLQIEAERKAAAVALRSDVGSLALDLASGVIRESLADDRRAAALVDRFLADLEESESVGRSSSERRNSVPQGGLSEEQNSPEGRS